MCSVNTNLSTYVRADIECRSISGIADRLLIESRIYRSLLNHFIPWNNIIFSLRMWFFYFFFFLHFNGIKNVWTLYRADFHFSSFWQSAYTYLLLTVGIHTYILTLAQTKRTEISSLLFFRIKIIIFCPIWSLLYYCRSIVHIQKSLNASLIPFVCVV